MRIRFPAPILCSIFKNFNKGTNAIDFIIRQFGINTIISEREQIREIMFKFFNPVKRKFSSLQYIYRIREEAEVV
jgi:hypothetical protein